MTDHTTTWQMLTAAAERFPERDMFVAMDDDGARHSLTYAELLARAKALSAGLAATGVRRGDRLVLWMTNRSEWIVTYLAAARLGAAVVPVNTFLKAPEIAYVIAQSSARHLVMLDRFRTLDMPTVLAEICPAFGKGAPLGHIGDAAFPDLRNVIQCSRSGEPVHGAFDWHELAATTDPEAQELADRIAARVQPTDLAMVKYTSGSTGFPKGVMLEQGGIVANARMHSRRVGIGSHDVFFSMMPFFHGGGSIWGLSTMLANAGTLVFTEAFNPAYATKLIGQEKATVMFGVLAAEVVDMAVATGRTFDSLRIAHLPNEAARAVMPNVDFGIIPFGLTEAYGPAAVNSPSDPADRRMTTTGRILDGNALRVVNPETGIDVPAGTVGEAWISGNVMRGYWNNPEATAKVLRSDGWLRSEDLVRVDEEGFITYVGRLKLMLKVGGENVSIEEVEKVIAGYPAIGECAAVGVADARKGEAVRAYVALTEPCDDIAAKLLDWLKPRLAHFKLPRDVVVIDALPRLANGKVDRVTLQQRAKAEEQDA